MSDIIRIATYFLSKEPMTLHKLQKLSYYAQAWSLKKYHVRLFEDDIEAWLEGPVVPELYHMFKEHGIDGIPMRNIDDALYSQDVMETLEFVYNSYGHYSADELEWLSKRELPWRQARESIEPWEGSRHIITCEHLKSVDTDYVDDILSSKKELPVSFGFKLWDFKLENNEDAISRGDWFQEILAAMSQLTGMTKRQLSEKGYLRRNGHRLKLLDQFGFEFKRPYREQYRIQEIMIRDKECSLFGVFIDHVFHLVWFVSKRYKGPAIGIDERINMALQEERKRQDKLKMFELEKENKELQTRNRELWDLLDEMTDPKVKMYKQ